MRNTLGLLLFASATLIGCAADGIDSPGNGPRGGGKADGEEGLHVVARVTKLGDFSEIRWPEAVDTYSEVDDLINSKLGFEDITGENLDEIIRKWETGTEEVQQGVVSADFTVDGNVRNVLSLTISYETVYAYPDFHNAYLNFNSNTGASIGITDILTAQSLPVIASRLDVVLQTRIAALKTKLAAEIASGEVSADQWDGLHVTAEDLESYSTTPEVITFHYDPVVPHAIVALAPDGEFKVTLEQLDPAISPDGLWDDEY
jgi:hypothetical protein